MIKQYAGERAISLGQAASDLVHRGAGTLPRFEMKNGWVVFSLPQDAAPLTNEALEELEASDYEQEYTGALSPRR